MTCSSCGTENPEKIKFCGECGAGLKNVVPSCGFENPPAFKFCGECAAPLRAAVAEPAPAAAAEPGVAESRSGQSEREPAAEASADRRQITVMFCDLAELSEISRKLDPEELREIIRSFQQSCRAVVERFGGNARYVGDDLKVDFGYPQAHEDD